MVTQAQVAELVYALVLGTSVARLEGSSPSPGTERKSKFICSCRDEKGFSFLDYFRGENHLAM